MSKPFDMPPVSAGFDVRGGWLIGRLIEDLAPPFNAIHAAGIVGNLGGESGLLPDINEKAPLVPGSRGGFGWEQATGVRRRALEADAAGHGLAVGTDEANYGFLLDELTGTEHRALVGLEKTQTVEDAVRVFEVMFERPSDPEGGLRARIAFAKRALANYFLHNGQAPAAPIAVPAVPDPAAPAFERKPETVPSTDPNWPRSPADPAPIADPDNSADELNRREATEFPQGHTGC